MKQQSTVPASWKTPGCVMGLDTAKKKSMIESDRTERASMESYRRQISTKMKEVEKIMLLLISYRRVTRMEIATEKLRHGKMEA